MKLPGFPFLGGSNKENPNEFTSNKVPEDARYRKRPEREIFILFEKRTGAATAVHHIEALTSTLALKAIEVLLAEFAEATGNSPTAVINQILTDMLGPVNLDKSEIKVHKEWEVKP